MNDVYIYALCVTVPLLFVLTGFRDRVAPLIDRVFLRVDLPSRREDFDPDGR